jgi:tetratricopeptide (TPR) repeat protein
MIRFLRYWVIALFALANISFARAKEADKDMVIAQMNSCVNTLTNIINNKSMSVLEHETNQLLNNLTMEHIVGLSEIAEFREELIDEIGRLSINEEERKLLRRINNLKADNLKWQAFNNALSNTMMLTGGGNNAAQLGFQALVTAARTGLEYKVAKNELEIEELQAMWDLRKSDLEYFVKLRKTAIGIVFSLYQKYNLKESDRLTEQSSLQFSRIVSDGNAGRMIRLLKDNESKYKHLADYYYYLGMGYIDTKNVAKAMEAFSQYEQMYAKTPIYRINEKLGLIALTRLAYLPKRTSSEVEKDISVALSNLPDNEVAIVQCAAIYNSVLNNPAKALSVLRSGLDNENIVDKSGSSVKWIDKAQCKVTLS